MKMIARGDWFSCNAKLHGHIFVPDLLRLMTHPADIISGLPDIDIARRHRILLHYNLLFFFMHFQHY